MMRHRPPDRKRGPARLDVKTACLYDEVVKLLNVRLSPDDARRAAALRKDGVAVSRIVREAIRAAYERRTSERGRARRARAIMAEIYRDHPDPPGQRRTARDLRDRRAVRRAIRMRLAHRRS
jgi:post-segregation antitoxin (ccd killing protein)